MQRGNFLFKSTLVYSGCIVHPSLCHSLSPTLSHMAAQNKLSHMCLFYRSAEGKQKGREPVGVSAGKLIWSQRMQWWSISCRLCRHEGNKHKGKGNNITQTPQSYHSRMCDITNTEGIVSFALKRASKRTLDKKKLKPASSGNSVFMFRLHSIT